MISGPRPCLPPSLPSSGPIPCHKGSFAHVCGHPTPLSSIHPSLQTAPPWPPGALGECTLMPFLGKQTWEETQAGPRASPEPPEHRIWASCSPRAYSRAGGKSAWPHVLWLRVEPFKAWDPKHPSCSGQKAMPVLSHPLTLHYQVLESDSIFNPGSGYKQHYRNYLSVQFLHL